MPLSFLRVVLSCLSTTWIPVEAIPIIVTSLAETMDTDELAVSGDFAERFAWRSATLLLKALLRRLTGDERSATVQSPFNEGRALGWLTDIVRDEIFAHGLYGDRPIPESDWILNEE